MLEQLFYRLLSALLKPAPRAKRDVAMRPVIESPGAQPISQPVDVRLPPAALPRPRNLVKPFPGCGELRADMVRLQEYIYSQASRPPVDFLVLPEDAHRWGPYWRVYLHVNTRPPRTLGLELYGDVRLGRGHAADLDLSVYGGYELGVSRQHALLKVRPGSLTITDLNSANGTIVNSAYLIPGQPFELFDGDTFSLGNLLFFLTIVYRPDPNQTALHSSGALTG